MEPVPANITKTYPPRGPIQQFRFASATAFECFRCGRTKKAKLISVYQSDWSKRVCNGCYGALLSIYDIKAGTEPNDKRAEKLAAALLGTVSADDLKQAERRLLAANSQAQVLTAESIRFLATAEHVAEQLTGHPQLEWSPAVIGLCTAIEAEVVARVLVPLSQLTTPEELRDDKKDKDLGRVASFCADPTRKPPELGSFAHFLQTVINSERRRESSKLIQSFLQQATDWPKSGWLLSKDGFHQDLVVLTQEFRNPAAHINELGQQEYNACRELVLGPSGMLWKLVLATEPD